jgi:hypothetical protein
MEGDIAWDPVGLFRDHRPRSSRRPEPMVLSLAPSLMAAAVMAGLDSDTKACPASTMLSPGAAFGPSETRSTAERPSS